MTTSSGHSSEGIAREREQKILALKRREEERAAQRLAQSLDIQYRNLLATPVDGAALTLVSLEEQKEGRAAIIQRADRLLTVGTPAPESQPFLAFKEALTKKGFSVHVVILSETSLLHAWEAYPRFAYLRTRTTGEVAVSEEMLERFQEEILDIRNLTNLMRKTAQQDISAFVELLLAGALRLEASDIHIEPQEKGPARVRYRLDGLLHDVTDIQKATFHFIRDRLKLLAQLKLNIAHSPQDGRFSITVGTSPIDVRISTLPSPHGEFLVMRLLNPKHLLSISELGLRKDLLSVIEEELRKPNGMILTTGPTGSGKTTMLYAFLLRVAKPELKIITIEDPIEYRLEDIEQTQVEPAENYTFAQGLRSIVRQDPDVVLVGEIRDEETADIATNAALTGHLVFSTLHTNDAAGAIPRLIEMEVNPTVLGPALNAVMAQRLVRRVCAACSQTQPLDATLHKTLASVLANIPKILLRHDLKKAALRIARGCNVCHNTGYRGRIGIFELFLVDETMERFILKRPAVVEMRTLAIQRGMITLQQDALLRVLEGVTTVDEVIRVTGPLVLPHEATVPLESADVTPEK